LLLQLFVLAAPTAYACPCCCNCLYLLLLLLMLAALLLLLVCLLLLLVAAAKVAPFCGGVVHDPESGKDTNYCEIA